MKDYEVFLYDMKEIEKEQFLTYQNASDIIETITEKYSESKKELPMVFLSVENGLIIVNIGIEHEDYYEYNYETYLINADQVLELIESGQGTYANHVLDGMNYVKIIDYSDENNTVTVQIVERLNPRKEEDRERLQQLIDENEIEDSDAVWDSKYYLYTHNNEETYHLADDVKLTLRDKDINLHRVSKDRLKEDLSDLLLSITMNNHEIYEITEPYMS